MELLDAYVKEVGERLPEKQHADLEQEIRSMIEDTLADEGQAQGREPDEAMLVGVLKKLGPPQKLAASYLPPRYLIGPELYPAYWMVLRIAVSVILVTAVIGAGIGLALSSGPWTEIARVALNAAGGLINSIFLTLGVITLIFGIIQVVVPLEKRIRDEGDWDPVKLKGKVDEDRVKPSSLIGEIVALIIALVFINFFTQLIGVGAVHDGKMNFVSILSPAFYQYIPWLSLLWIAQTILHIVVAYLGHWTIPARWVSVAIRLFGIGLAYRMLNGPSLVSVSPAGLAAVLSGVPLATQQSLVALIGSAVLIAIGVTIIVSVIELAADLYRLLLKGRLPFLRVLKNG